MKNYNSQIALNCFSLVIAIIFGALGAHKLKNLLPFESVESFKTGVFYHMFHALALIMLYSVQYFNNLPGIRIARLLMQLGILFFSFSIYFLTTAPVTRMEMFKAYLGPVTPFGGLMFITAWGIIGLAAWRTRQTKATS